MGLFLLHFHRPCIDTQGFKRSPIQRDAKTGCVWQSDNDDYITSFYSIAWEPDEPPCGLIEKY